MPHLVPPGEDVHASFVQAVREHAGAREPVPADPAVLAHPVGFRAYLAMLETDATPAGAPPGQVPQTTWWWCDGEHYLGRVHVRHRLSDPLRVVGGHIGYAVRPSERGRGHATAMLRAVLPHARALGIDRALVTCAVTNVASRTVIESNGGVPTDPLEPQTLRFWVPTG